MKKIIAFFLFALLLSGCGKSATEKYKIVDSIDVNQEKETIWLGYCPTMKEDAYKLKTKNKGLEIVEFSSAGETLTNLKMKQIDVALIGRKAKKSEIVENASEFMLENQGYTLIAPQRQIISESELTDLHIYSCLSLDPENIFPGLHVTFQDCNYKNGEVWLVSWKNFNDNFELLIPVHHDGKKIRAFRSAFLYVNTKQNQLNF